MIRVIPHEPDSVLTTGQVAQALGISRRSVLRIPLDRLPCWRTPGGESTSHHRYALADVVVYAAGLGLTLTSG